MRKTVGYLGLVATLFLGAGVAQADIITFSGAISDDDGPGPEAFNATIDWTFNALDQILCVTIFNETVAPDAYTISVLQFNTSDNVTDLALISDELSPFYNGDYPNASSGDGNGAGGFGGFDWNLDLGTGNNGINNGLSTTFYFQASGNLLTEDDFFSHGTTHPSGGGVAVIHFTRGPEGDSAWGIPGTENEPPPPITVVPEPASMTLMGLGLAAMLLRQTRRKIY